MGEAQNYHMRATMSATLPGAVLLLLPVVMAFPLQDVHWTEKWRLVADGGGEPHGGGGECVSPGVATHDGTIYISTGPNIKAFSLNGTSQWNLTRAGLSCYALRVGPDGTLYTVDTTGNESFIAVNPNGTVKWQVSDSDFGPDTLRDATAFNSKGDTLFVYSTTGYLTALSNGKRVWSKFMGLFRSDDRRGPQLVFGQGLLYVTTEATLFAMMPNGDVTWRFDLSKNTTSQTYKQFSQVYGAVTLGPGGTVYVPIQVISQSNSDQSLHLYALGPDGSLNWDVDIGATTDAQYNTLSVGTPAVSLDGSLVFVSVAEPLPGGGMVGSLQYLVAVTAKGLIKWHQTPTKTYQAPYQEPIVSPRDGLVYVSGSASELSALSPDSGQVVWAYTPPRADSAKIGFASDGKTMLVSEFLATSDLQGQFVILQSN